MIIVSTKELLNAIEEADIYRLPDMSEGTSYLYSNLCKRLSRNEEVKLSEIDFNSFELDDVDSMRDIYFNIEAEEDKSDSLARTLRALPPMAAAAAFV